MTLRDFERRLQSCNDQLHIKTYGASKAGVFKGNKYICRIGPGEIMPYNQFTYEYGENGQYASDLNPKGKYKYKRLIERGRAETARVLYTQRHLTLADISTVSK